MAFCSSCGQEIPAGATVCPQCSVAAGSEARGQTGGLADNVAGMLAYVTIIPAIIFLVMEPYNKNRFIRFHSFQCIFFEIAWFVLCIALSIVTRGLLTLLVFPLMWLGGLVIWIVLLLKAYQGQMFKLPVVGDLAEKQANA